MTRNAHRLRGTQRLSARTKQQHSLVISQMLSGKSSHRKKMKQERHLGKVLEDNDHDVEQVLGRLKKEIEGFGSTGADIFLRRVQWVDGWHKAFPSIDGKSQHALTELGLPSDGKAPLQAIDRHWSKLETKHLAGTDQVVKKRRAFVIVLERATGAQLEGKLEEMLEAAKSGIVSE